MTYPAPWSKLARDFRALLSRLPMEVSVIAANDFKENFRRQGYINRGGVLIPWRKRASMGTGRNRTRAVLVKSGYLLRANQPKPFPMTARVINNAPYAAAHNEGVDETVTVKAHRRGLYQTTKRKTKTGRASTRVERTVKAFAKVRAYQRKMYLPRRPFMVNSPILDKAIAQHVDKQLDTIWRKH